MLTKKAARQIADRQLSYGRHESGCDIWVRCPACTERVEAVAAAWDKPAARQRLMRDALVSHLLVDCSVHVRGCECDFDLACPAHAAQRPYVEALPDC